MSLRMMSTKWKPTCDVVFHNIERVSYPKCFCENSLANEGICKWRYDQTCHRSRYQMYLPPYTITDFYHLKDGVPQSVFWRNTNN